MDFCPRGTLRQCHVCSLFIVQEKGLIFMSSSSGRGRTRNYATVIYLDSAPSDWYERLCDLHVAAFVSPYHDKDINPTGEAKKPHFHIMLMFDGVKTEEQASELFAEIGGVGCEVIKSLRAYARYLCHLDNPDKVQYDVSEVRQVGGADYMNVIGLPQDKYIAIREMMEFIQNNDIKIFADLLEYAAANKTDWFISLCDNSSYVIKEYIKSRHYEESLSKRGINSEV